MTDNKLDELNMNNASERVWIGKSEYVRKDIAEKKKQEALKPIREVQDLYIKGKVPFTEFHSLPPVVVTYIKILEKAIKTALEEK